MTAIALWLPNPYVARRSSAMTYVRASLLEPARIAALTTAGQPPWHKFGAASRRHELGRNEDWQTNCVISGVYRDGIDYVQDHAKHVPRLHSCRSSANGRD